ncbi:hypothetical protein B0O99DRAFT_291226 [Bisporella sp. PMI_857]|nr:hypothetical protein B0O99DRAFT_291226 [Bisporella sp. PMI_857]
MFVEWHSSFPTLCQIKPQFLSSFHSQKTWAHIENRFTGKGLARNVFLNVLVGLVAWRSYPPLSNYDIGRRKSACAGVRYRSRSSEQIVIKPSSQHALHTCKYRQHTPKTLELPPQPSKVEGPSFFRFSKWQPLAFAVVRELGTAKLFGLLYETLTIRASRSKSSLWRLLGNEASVFSTFT